MRYPVEIVAGIALSWLARDAAVHDLAASHSTPAAPPTAAVAPVTMGGDPPYPPAQPAPIGPAFDDDAAMAKTADPVASYTLHASLDPVKHVVEGKGTITWRNASRIPQGEVWLHLYLNAFKNERTYFMRFPGVDGFRGAGTPGDWGHVDVKRFAIEGGADLWPGADKTSPGDPDDETDIRVPLPEPVQPGATVRFDVAFETHLPSLLFRTGYVGGFHMVGQWFPKLARLEADGRWAHWPFHHLSEFYADFGTYDVTVDTPDDEIVGATGQLEGEVRRGGRVERRFVQENVHDFAFAAWSKFRELTGVSDGGVALRVLYPPGFDRDAEVELESAKFGLSHLGRAFGRYPYKTLTMIHPPPGAEEGGGMEYPTLITTGGSWYFPWTGARIIDIVTIHELGHQWFYGLVATDEHGWPFLDEGINSYAEVDAMEAKDPHTSAIGAPGLSIGIAAFNRARASEVERDAKVAQPASDFLSGRDYGGLVYGRTATILETLANVYGKDEVRRAVGRYARRYRFEHPGPEDLLQAVREVVGADAAEQLRRALFERATVDYAVGDITTKAEGDGYTGSVLVFRRGALRFPVDVDLVEESGAVQHVRWDAADSAARLPFHGKTKLVAAVIDPDHKVMLDDDLTNNAQGPKSRVSGGLLDRLSFVAEALLGGLVP